MELDHYKENNLLEVKTAAGGLPRSLWETYSAMSNSDGGRILLGVRERSDGSLEAAGVSDPDKLVREFWNSINDPGKVSINLLTDRDVAVLDFNGKAVIQITIPRARRNQKPVYINGNLFGGTYRRNGEGDYHCTREEIKSMLRDQTEETMDMRILNEMSLDDLNRETIREYRARHQALHPGHVWEQLCDEDFLERIGAARRSGQDGKLHPTGAGLLMFGDEYKILYEYPEYFLDYQEILDPEIRWTDRLQSSSGDWSGNLFDFFFRVSTKLTRDLKIPFLLDGITRVDDTPVHKAMREALANCLVNADFFVPRGIVIRKRSDEILIENPGYVRTGKDQMLRGGITDPRNRALMKMFNLIGIGERAGSAVPDIFRVWSNNRWENPEIIEEHDPDRTILILSFRENKRMVRESSGSFSENCMAGTGRQRRCT